MLPPVSVRPLNVMVNLALLTATKVVSLQVMGIPHF